MSTLNVTNLQNGASGSVNLTLNANGTSTFGGVVTFDGAQTFPNSVSSITAGTGLTGGTITSTGTIALDTVYTDGLYLQLAGGTMTGDITFSATQTFPTLDLQTVTDNGATTTNGITVDTLVTTNKVGINGPTGTSTLTVNGTIYSNTVTTFGNYQIERGGIAVGLLSGDLGSSYLPSLSIAGLSYPTADGATGEVMTTDGAGNLGWLATAEVVAVPANSGAGGSFGQIAFGSGNFYFHDGAQWWQVAGVSF